jgi:hypothetical protein
MWIIVHGPTCPRLMIAAQNAADAREAAEARQAAAEAAEKARVARVAEQARMAAQGAEQLRQMRNAADTELARLKAAMAAAHPDRGGDAAAFIAALHAYRAARRGKRCVLRRDAPALCFPH